MWLSEFESQLCGLEKGAWETMLLKMYQWTVAKFTPVKYTPCCDHLLRKKSIVLLDFLLSSNSSIYIPVMCALMPHATGNHWSRTFTAALKLRGLNSIYILWVARYFVPSGLHAIMNLEKFQEYLDDILFENWRENSIFILFSLSIIMFTASMLFVYYIHKLIRVLDR